MELFNLIQTFNLQFTRRTITMKKIKLLAIITTAVCGFYFTTAAQTETQSSTQQDKQSSAQDQSSMQSSQQSDEISLNESPTVEKSSQGYKIQVWVLPEESTAASSEFDSRYDSRDDALKGTSGSETKSTKSSDFDKSGTDYNKDLNKDKKSGTDYNKDSKIGTDYNKSGTGIDKKMDASGTGTIGSTGVSGSGNVSGSGVSGTIGTTNPAGTTGSTGTTSTIGSSSSTGSATGSGTIGTTSQSDRTQSSSTWNQSDKSADNQNSGISRDDWRAQSNQTGQSTGMKEDKSMVYVKVIDEKSGAEVNAKDIEMKVITPSKKSFTTDLKEKEDMHMGELALTEDGTYNMQATIHTEDNKSVVIPFTYDNNVNTSMDQSSDIDSDIK